MAKRPTQRSQADDTGTAAPPQPRARRSKGSAAGASESAETAEAMGATLDTNAPPAASDTQPARGDVDSPDPDDLDRPEALTSESVSMGSEPSEEDIRMRAYHRYLERGGAPGSDFDDWLEAERELREKR
jgi:hypothetical protein